MKLKEILNILPKYRDGSGYDEILINNNVPSYQFNYIDMYNFKTCKQEITEKCLNSEVVEINIITNRDGYSDLAVYLDYK